MVGSENGSKRMNFMNLKSWLSFFDNIFLSDMFFILPFFAIFLIIKELLLSIFTSLFLNIYLTMRQYTSNTIIVTMIISILNTRIPSYVGASVKNVLINP